MRFLSFFQILPIALFPGIKTLAMRYFLRLHRNKNHNKIRNNNAFNITTFLTNKAVIKVGFEVVNFLKTKAVCFIV